MFREVEGIEIFKMSRDIVPENSRCISNCLFTTTDCTFDTYTEILSRCISGVLSMYLTDVLSEILKQAC